MRKVLFSGIHVENTDLEFAVKGLLLIIFTDFKKENQWEVTYTSKFPFAVLIKNNHPSKELKSCMCGSVSILSSQQPREVGLT